MLPEVPKNFKSSPSIPGSTGRFSFSHLLQNGIFCMILSSLFFAMMGGFVKFALQKIPVPEVVFFRSIVSAVILGYALWRRKESFLGNRPLLLLGRGLAGFTAINLNFYAVSHIPLGDAAILNQTSPLFVAFFSVVLLKETLSPRAFFFSMLSLAGVAFIVKPSLSGFHLPALAGLGSGIMAALAYVAIRQLHATDSFLTMAFYFAAVSATLSIPGLALGFEMPDLQYFMVLMGAGLAGTLGQLLMTYAYKNEEASIVSPFSYIAILFSFGIGIRFFGEIPDRYTLIGALLVIASCIGLMRVRAARKGEQEENPSLEME